MFASDQEVLGFGSMSSDSSLALSNALAGGENPLADV